MNALPSHRGRLLLAATLAAVAVTATAIAATALAGRPGQLAAGYPAGRGGRAGFPALAAPGDQRRRRGVRGPAGPGRRLSALSERHAPARCRKPGTLGVVPVAAAAV